MPSRRRTKPAPTPSSPPDPIEQFAALIRESAERERADRARADLAKQQQREAAQAAAEHAAALDAARGDLDRAIADARRARQSGSGIAVADEAWRRAKARLIELETGSRPTWAPPDDPVDPADAGST